MRKATEAEPITLDEIRPLAAARFGDMINLRPSFGNRSRSVDDPTTRTAIAAMVARLVRR